MMYQERLFKILKSPHISEKTSVIARKNSVIVFKVARYATKKEIKDSVIMLFAAQVNSVNTVVIKGKIKGSGNNIGCRNTWKKAYVMLEQGQKINFLKK